MNSVSRKIIFVWILCSFLFLQSAATVEDEPNTTSVSVGRKLYEEGRTLVHHAVKRFMIILPAIFFKLGAAFTLLILVTIGVVTNGIIGFLLLVVGLSSVLARLQNTEKPQVVPIPYFGHSLGHAHSHYAPLSPYGAWKRSDDTSASQTITTDNSLTYQYGSQVYKPSLGYNYASYSPTN